MPKNELKIGIVLNYVNIAIGNLIPLIYTPIMLRLLGQEEYGLYKLSSVVTGYLGLISLGLGSAITRYLIKARTEEGQEAEERMLGLFVSIFRIVAACAFVLGMVLVMNLDVWYADSLSDADLHKMRILVSIMVCNTALSFSMAPYMSVVTVHEKFIFFQCMNIINTSVIPIVNLVVLYMGYASVGLATSSLAIAVFVRLVYFVFVRHSLHISPRFSGFPKGILKEIFMFSFWVFVGDIVSLLYSSTDTILIGALPALAMVGVAIYNIGIVFDQIISGCSAGISGLLTPKINKMVFEGRDKKELVGYAVAVGRLQCCIAACLVAGFVVFGKPIIHFYVGDEYLEAYWVMLFISIPKIIVLAQTVCLSIIVAQNRHQFRSKVYLCVAIANAVGTWLVLPYWGIEGAAFMSGLSFFVGHGLIMNWYYNNKMQLDMVYFWRQILKVLYVPVLMCVVGLMCVRYVDLYNVLVLLVTMAVFGVVLFLLLWMFGLNGFEKGLLVAPLRKMRIVR